MSQERAGVTMEARGPVAFVSVDRPEALNALSPEIIESLHETFAAIAQDGEVRSVVLTGGGSKAFVAGADIRIMKEFGPEEAKAYAERGQALMRRIEELGKPVVAAVNGFALGGGCELAMACHLRIASSKARFGQPEVNLGVMPGFGGSQRLHRIVGRGRALQLLLTGEMIGAEEAERIGLVQEVVEPEALADRALDLASSLAAKGPLALRWTLEAALIGESLSMEAGCALEANLFGLCFSTRDQEEGMAAFLEKREAKFEGS